MLQCHLVAGPVEDMVESVSSQRCSHVGDTEYAVNRSDTAMDRIGHGCDQVPQELGSDHFAGLLMQFDLKANLLVRSIATNRRSLSSAVCTSAMSMWKL